MNDLKKELLCISPLDGRYAKYTNPLTLIFSEFGLIRGRIWYEIKWLIFLSKELRLFDISELEEKNIRDIFTLFNVSDAEIVKQLEKETNHDVKAVEYYIKKRFEPLGLSRIKEWVHIFCTSEDVTNVSIAKMFTDGRHEALQALNSVISKIEELAKLYRSVPMMSHTHGQPASPTTVGKEFINFAWRLRQQISKLKSVEIEAKVNGASGNFNAHHLTCPDINWIYESQNFIQKLGFTPQIWSTQINNYSYISEMFQVMIRISSILIDLNRDMWGYISMNYFTQKTIKGEVGSSTMPHKVNPIDFENSEGNLGIGISIMEHMSVKLLNSRFQRDLTDSTVLRNLGVCFGHFLIGLKSAYKGLGKIEINEPKLQEDLEENPELLSEAVQSAMRAYGVENSYEKLKDLTRGKRITAAEMNEFIYSQKGSLPDHVIERLLIVPANYTGLAKELVERYFQTFKR